MLDRKPSDIPIHQDHINAQLEKFCKKYQKTYDLSDSFIKKINADGQCSGYASRFLLGIRLEEMEGKKTEFKKDYLENKPEKPPRDDLTFFRFALETISLWDGVRELSAGEKWLFNTLLYQLYYLQNPHEYFTVSQPDLDKFIYESQDRKLVREFCFGGCETQITFEKLLKDTVKPTLLILLSSKQHSIALYQTGSSYVFYDSNCSSGWVVLSSLSEVAQHAFTAWNHDSARRSSISIHIFSYQQKAEEKQKKSIFTPHRILLDKCQSGVKFNAIMQDRKDATPMWMAAKAGDAKSVKYYLDHGHNPNEPVESNAKPLLESTPLLVAAEMGQLSVVNTLLAHPRTNVNIMDENGSTPLFFAVKYGHISVVKRLLEEKNIDLDCELNHDGSTVLHEAVRLNDVDVVKMLLQKGSGLDVHKSLYDNSPGLCCCLFSKPPRTALTLALRYQYWKCAVWILIYSNLSQLSVADKKTVNASKKELTESFFSIVQNLSSDEEKRSVLQGVLLRSNALGEIINPEIKTYKVVPAKSAELAKSSETVPQRIEREFKESSSPRKRG